MTIIDLNKIIGYPIILSPYEYLKIDEREVDNITQTRISQKIRTEFRQGKEIPIRMSDRIPEKTEYNATQIIIAATILYFFILIHYWIYAGAYVFVLALYIYRNRQEDKRKILNYKWRQENIVKENNKKYDEFMEEERILVLKVINEDKDLTNQIRKEVFAELVTRELSKYKAEKPQNLNEIDPTLSSNLIKGKTEAYFNKSLKDYFRSEDIEILSNCQLGFYYPDLVLIHSSGLIIDIEIDEPYTLPDKKPIHFFYSKAGVHSDFYRNLYFLEKGWLVIRFTEKQIINETEACCYQIDFELSMYLLSETKHKKFPLLIDGEAIWTEQKAIKWSEIDYRNTYLPEKLKYDPNRLQEYTYRSNNKPIRINSYKEFVDDGLDELGFPLRIKI